MSFEPITGFPRGDDPAGRAASAYEKIFHFRPEAIVRAPGRVNLIGGHTDYSEGFVMPLAIDREVAIAVGRRQDTQVVVRSLQIGGEVRFKPGEPHTPDPGWGDYIRGVAEVMNQSGYTLKGWQGVVSADIPIGAGLGSSAALTVAAVRAFVWAAGAGWVPLHMAKIAQRAENEWAHVDCGIMDQLAATMGRKGNVLLIDCRSLAVKTIPLPPETGVLILDTGTRRGLVDTIYNERRRQCELAARHFGIETLRDLDPGTLESRGGELDEAILRRARHVVGENQRVLDAAETMERGDVAELGELLNAGHDSLRVDFEVSSPALDGMVECARRLESCYGARMTGAGFGGCAVALVRSDDLSGFISEVAACFAKSFDSETSIFPVKASDGASVEAVQA